MVVGFLAACSAASLSGAHEKTESMRTLERAGLTGVDLLKAAQEVSEWVVKVRRELHQHPELMYDLNVTTTIVKRLLDEIGHVLLLPGHGC